MGGLAFEGAAQAQSSITLYGVVDAPIEYVNHMAIGAPMIDPVTGTITQKSGGNRVALGSGGGMSGSRWGLRGSEDLGGGLQALFVLESSFGIDDGRSQDGGRLFGRQAYVGIQSSKFGKLTLGRQYTSMLDVFGNFSPLAYATLYEPVVAQLGPNFREDNTIKYTGVFGGLTTEAHWSFGAGVNAIGVVPLAGSGAGETPGHFRDNSAYGAGVAYAAGPFGAAIAYDQWNPAISVGKSGTAKKAGVAGSYAFGSAQIMAGYRWGQGKDGAGNTLLRDDYYWVGANYQFTTALGLTLAYYYDNVKTLRVSPGAPATSPANPWQISFVMDYNLSKHTDVYLTMAYTKNAGLNFDTSAEGFANGYFLSEGKANQFGAAVGIRHKF